MLASGRDSNIYEFGEGLVLRRAVGGRVIDREAEVMTYVAERGYPVPRIHEVRAGGTEIVMERLTGPTMMEVLARAPLRCLRYVSLLADLHDRLHRIVAPASWPAVGEGDRCLHLDLHPMNVMMTDRGPVVIDWANAHRGHPLTDVGATYVLLTCPRVPLPRAVGALLRPLRVAMANRFIHRYAGTELPEFIADAAERKALDPNMDAGEAEECRRLAARMRGGGRGTQRIASAR